MVNLTIRLSKGTGAGAVAGAAGDGSSSLGATGDGPAVGSEPAVTVSCPDHLVLADLPVAKGLGSVSDITLVKVLGRKARRRLGDKVHFCVRCDFPIAIYGRLDPCEHIFCLTCARRDSTCYLCGERVLRIQRMEVLDGIFICGAPRCLRSFIKRQDFQLHVKESHVDLIEPADDTEKTQHDVDFQKGASSEPQVQTQALSRSPSAIQLPMQEQRNGPALPQSSETQPPRAAQQKGTPSSNFEEKQVPKSEFEHQKQQPIHGDRPRRQRQERQQMEETHFEEQAQPDLQQVLQVPQQLQPGILAATQPVIPVFSPQPFPPPYPMQQEGHGMQPIYPPFQIPPGGHLLPSPPLPPPRPPSVAPPPPLMPPPPPKRNKFEPGITPSGDPQMDMHGYVWSSGNPSYDSNRNYGGWPAS